MRPMCRFDILSTGKLSDTTVTCQSHAAWFFTDNAEPTRASKSKLVLTKARLFDELMCFSGDADGRLTGIKTPCMGAEINYVVKPAIASWENQLKIEELTIIDDCGQILNFTTDSTWDERSGTTTTFHESFFQQFPNLRVLNLFTYSLKQAPYLLPGSLKQLTIRGDLSESNSLGVRPKEGMTQLLATKVPKDPKKDPTVMPNLQILDLSNAGLSSWSIPDSFFDRMPSLRELDLSNNKLTGLLLSWNLHTAWKTLEKLSLRSNSINYIENGFFHKFSFSGGLDMTGQYEVGSDPMEVGANYKETFPVWPLGAIANLMLNDDGVWDPTADARLYLDRSMVRGMGEACNPTYQGLAVHKACESVGCTWQKAFDLSSVIFCGVTPPPPSTAANPAPPKSEVTKCAVGLNWEPTGSEAKRAQFRVNKFLLIPAKNSQGQPMCSVETDAWNCAADRKRPNEPNQAGCSGAEYCRCPALMWSQNDVDVKALRGGSDSQREDVRYLYQSINQEKERRLRAANTAIAASTIGGLTLNAAKKQW
jgi:hypothetical protein